ncbi:MAG: type II secretion system GspH family protein [Puniceicoccales bacterium]|jgi:prepilin-type N-terminal cleavage/methylation domain-containing protein|nr:type II secretion system GspH family protein [Puniceicoccales bacterium]
MYGNKRAGFSLLEVLLAMGLVGVAMPGLITLWISQITALDTGVNMMKLLNAEKNFLAITSGDVFDLAESGDMFMVRVLEVVGGENIYKTILGADMAHLPLAQDGEIFVITFAKDIKNSLDGACTLYHCTVKLAMATSANFLKIRANAPKHVFSNFNYKRVEM